MLKRRDGPALKINQRHGWREVDLESMVSVRGRDDRLVAMQTRYLSELHVFKRKSTELSIEFPERFF